MLLSTKRMSGNFVIVCLLGLVSLALWGCPSQEDKPPAASFTASTHNGPAPLTVSFMNNSTAANATWSWTFGDGGTSTEQSPSHTYTTPGTWTVYLYATNAYGTDSAYTTIVVSDSGAEGEGEGEGEGGLVRYVKPDGTGDGTSWATASGSIQAAVDAAAATGGKEVWVMAGTYTSTAFEVVKMAPHVDIYGGFAGTETARDQRDWDDHVTVIDGQSARRGVLGSNDAVLDGFTICNGYTYYRNGAGMLNEQASPTVSHCIFSTNRAIGGDGAGMCNMSCSPTVKDCTFDANGGVRGGGIYNESANPTITACLFANNSAHDGGGIYNHFASSTISDCTFFRNTGLGFMGEGGGIYSKGAATIVRCSFTENEAVGRGGGIINFVGSTIQGCDFSKNNVRTLMDPDSGHLWGGGGIYNMGANSTIADCTFDENSSGSDGGGLFSATGSTVERCVFRKNVAGLWGGAVFALTSPISITNTLIVENDAYRGGGLSGVSNGNIATLTNCTFSANHSHTDGGAISDMHCIITNCVLWDDHANYRGPETYWSNITLRYSCVAGGETTSGNIAADPQFVDPANMDYTLKRTSPCIDAGTNDGAPSDDLLGIPRPKGKGTDIGAYEGGDSDDDGLSDVWERRCFGDLSQRASGDPDGDMFSNLQEFTYYTDPNKPDTDGDGMWDGYEFSNGWDPTIISGTRCVKAGNTSGVEDGLTWESAFTSIQAAIDALGEGEVWVADGIYCATGSTVVVMKAKVNLYGGFAGTENLRQERDLKINHSVIDGEVLRGCVNAASFSILDGFVLQNGDSAAGGGIYCTRCESFTVANCTFIHNTAQYGAALYNLECDSTIRVENCVFRGNSADYGGGIYNAASSPIVINCSFTQNHADEGGAVANHVGYPKYINCIMWNDIANKENFNEITNFPYTGYSGHPDIITSCIGTDPKFVNADQGDLRLQAGSPCIDTGRSTGAPPADILGVTRPQGAGIDMGAYEHTED